MEKSLCAKEDSENSEGVGMTKGGGWWPWMMVEGFTSASHLPSQYSLE